MTPASGRVLTTERIGINGSGAWYSNSTSAAIIITPATSGRNATRLSIACVCSSEAPKNAAAAPPGEDLRYPVPRRTGVLRRLVLEGQLREQQGKPADASRNPEQGVPVERPCLHTADHRTERDRPEDTHVHHAARPSRTRHRPSGHEWRHSRNQHQARA